MAKGNDEKMRTGMAKTLRDWNKSERHYFEYLRKMPVVLAVLEILKNEMDYDANSLEEAARILAACAVGFLDYEDQPHPMTVKRFLTGLENGYGCWLDEIETAIGKAEIDADDRLFLLGAFFMVRQYLFDIEGHNNRFG